MKIDSSNFKKSFSRTILIPILLVFCLFFTFYSTASITNSAFDYTVTVIDENGETLVGVNVFTDDQKFTGTTDIEGKITLSNIAYSDNINFSYIGYNTLKIQFFEIRQLGGIIQLRPAFDLLPTIVVVGRRDDKPQDIPYQIGTIDKKKIELYNAQTTADALMQNENIFVQKSQMGGGSVNIRGFEANKVLFVVDGIRMNNIIYRKGHLQDAIKVDNGMLERIEVFYGPGSLTYGSDALGGVVHFRTKEPSLYDGSDSKRNFKLSTNAFVRYSSANEEKTAHADVNYGTQKWGSFTSVTYTDYGDLRAGSNRSDSFPDFGKRYQYVQTDDYDQIFSTLNPDIQTPTGYAQMDFMQKVKFQPNKNLFFIANLQLSTSTDVPRYDKLTELKDGNLKFSEWYYGPQQRLLFSLKSQILQKTALYEKATVIGGFQKLIEDRYERKLFKDWREFDWEDVSIYSLTADFDKNIGINWGTFTYGFDFNHNDLKSEAGQINIQTNQRAKGINTRYPSGGSSMTTLAGYGNYSWQSLDSIFGVFAGARYTWVNLDAIYIEEPEDEIIWPEYFYTDGINGTNDALTWSAGFTINTRRKWRLKVIGSSAFHAPNIDDAAKFREKNNAARIPNPELRPEKTLNGELTIGKEFGSVREKEGFNALISVTGWYTKMTDAIIEDNFQLPNGDTVFISDGDVYRVKANVNANEAYILGGSGSFLMTFGKRWELKSSLAYTKGRILEDGVEKAPLDHIPPLFGKSSLFYDTEKLRIGFVYRFNGEKPLEEYSTSGEDNLENATPNGTPFWQTFNVYSSIKFKKTFSIDFAIENIADLHYRPFASGISAAGRNYIITLRGSF